jgi:hypothetical protein
MGLPMIRPFCKGCKSIYRKECNVEVEEVCLVQVDVVVSS